MSASPDIPSHIGKYEIKRLLGKGAMGSVYLAVDPFGQREVALKTMEKLSSDPDVARKQLHLFQNESALAGKLRHPHIVSILDAGVDDLSGREPLRYLVMEVVEGGSLGDRCTPQTLLEPAQVIEIAYKCCKALEFANTLGIVHRDIKPANILLRGDLDIKVADFGAAQLAKGDVTQVAGVGSPAYMSPEQVKDEEIDWRTDVYSLGAVIYHLVTGQRPFGGANQYQLIEAILNTSPPPPSELRPQTPRGLDEIVRRAMSKTRAERFESWEEFASALAAVLRAQKDGGDLLDAEKFAASRRLKFFQRFSDVELWEAVNASTWKQHPAGEALITEGMPGEHFFILASGLLKVTQRGKLLNAVSPGECVGEMAYARRDGQKRSATVTAVEPSWAMRMKVHDVDKLSDTCRARFNEAFLSIMADRLSMLGGRLVAM